MDGGEGDGELGRILGMRRGRMWILYLSMGGGQGSTDDDCSGVLMLLQSGKESLVRMSISLYFCGVGNDTFEVSLSLCWPGSEEITRHLHLRYDYEITS